MGVGGTGEEAKQQNGVVDVVYSTTVSLSPTVCHRLTAPSAYTRLEFQIFFSLFSFSSTCVCLKVRVCWQVCRSRFSLPPFSSSTRLYVRKHTLEPMAASINTELERNEPPSMLFSVKGDRLYHRFFDWGSISIEFSVLSFFLSVFLSSYFHTYSSPSGIILPPHRFFRQ